MLHSTTHGTVGPGCWQSSFYWNVRSNLMNNKGTYEMYSYRELGRGYYVDYDDKCTTTTAVFFFK